MRGERSLVSPGFDSLSSTIRLLWKLSNRRHPDSNWGVEDLQSSALPLGYAAQGAGQREQSGLAAVHRLIPCLGAISLNTTTIAPCFTTFFVLVLGYHSRETA